MTTSKYRIPRMAAAALVLGGACGDDDDPTDGVNASKARAESINEGSCRKYAECYPEEFEEYYDSVADCAESYSDDEFDDYVDAYGEECVDALLDAAHCANGLTCKQIEEDDDKPCEKFEDKVYDICDFGYYSDSFSHAPATKLKRRFARRIPR